MLPHVPGDPPRDLSRPPDRLRYLVLPEEGGQRLDRLLARVLFWRSRASVQRLIDQGAVRVEGRPPARSGLKVRAGDLVTILLPPRPPLPAQAAAPGTLRVLFEDQWLIALDKPAGMAVHPAGRHLEGTLVGLLHQAFRRSDPAEDIVPRLCHRLDRETSGVILATKQETARHLLGRQFEERTIGKTYLAVVEGTPDPPAGIVDWPLAPDPGSRIRLKMVARRDGRGVPALTRYKVARSSGGRALLEVTLGTGRQHQIRAHLSALGHPVVGDKIYGPDEAFFLEALAGRLTEEASRRLVLPRHALHAWKLRFRHPATNQEMELQAPLPDDMAALV